MIGLVVLALILAIGVLLLLNERRQTRPQRGPQPIFDALARKHGDPLPARKHSRPLPPRQAA